MVEIEIDFTNGEYNIKDRRVLEELGYSPGENPYINIIEGSFEGVTLYCPIDKRKLFWNGAKFSFECLDCGYIPPDPRIEAAKQELEADELAEKLHGADNHKRIRTRRGRIATGERYTSVAKNLLSDEEDSGSAMELRPVLSQRMGLRQSPQDPPAAYVSRVGETALDADEQNMIRKGYTIKSRSEVTGTQNVVDTQQTLEALRRRLSRERAQKAIGQQ